MIDFDPTTHRYSINGRRVLSNTQVLELAGLCDYRHVDERVRRAALEIGKAVEEATLLYDRKQNWGVYSYVSGYVEAWMQFEKDFDFRPLLREQIVHDPILDYCTRLDAWGPSKDGYITVQIKTGKVDDWVAVQTAAEERAAWIHLGESWQEAVTACKSSPNRWGVELRSDGKYVPRRFNEGEDDGTKIYERDINVFISGITTARWKLAHGWRV